MKKFYALASCLLLFLNTAGISILASEEKMVNSINEFTLKLYKELIKTQNENVICSGFGLHTVLNMLLTGARGDTAKEINGTLGYNGIGVAEEQIKDSIRQLLTQLKENHGGYDLEVANSVWIQSGFNVLRDFKSIINDNFFVEDKEIDFGKPSSNDQINAWVSEKTNGRIPSLYDEPLDPITRLVLANAIYFKGRWAKKFDKEETGNDDFVSKGITKSVPMMNILENFTYSAEEDMQILEMPYTGNDVSMIIILPRSLDGLEAVEENLSLESLNGAIDGLSQTTVRVMIPKFSISSSLPLNSVFKSMGIVKAFDKFEADFSGINGERNLYVSESIQKADIEVNEEGTVAAAASAVKFTFRSSPLSFSADHPFVFFIRQKSTGLLLFIGRVVKL